MPIGAILSLVGPLVVKVASSLIDRFWSHGVSTIQGTAAGAAVLALLQQSGCDLSHLNQALIAIVAAAPGWFTTDAKKTAPTLLESAKKELDAAKLGQVSVDNL